MKKMNKQAMDVVLKNSLPKEIDLPYDISTEWQRLIDENSSYNDRIDWLDCNVLRLTFREYAIMFDSLLIYRDIEANPNLSLKEILSNDNEYKLLHKYFVVIEIALDELERRI